VSVRKRFKNKEKIGGFRFGHMYFLQIRQFISHFYFLISFLRDLRLIFC
jgi:hypothetical protein